MNWFIQRSWSPERPPILPPTYKRLPYNFLIGCQEFRIDDKGRLFFAHHVEDRSVRNEFEVEWGEEIRSIHFLKRGNDVVLYKNGTYDTWKVLWGGAHMKKIRTMLKKYYEVELPELEENVVHELEFV